MNGAVQGEAIATASTPERKSLATGCRACARASDDGARHAELEHAGQVEPDQGEQRGQRGHHRRRLQLEAPAQLRAGGAQRQHQRRPAPGTTAPRRRCRPAPAVRWPRRSSAWRAKPSTLIASTGNTQGIRLSSRPPSRAPSSAATKRAPTARRRRRRPRRCAVAARPAAPARPAARRGDGRPGAADRRFGAPGDRLARRAVGLGQRHHHRHHAGLALRWSASGTLRRPGVAVPGLGPVLAGTAAVWMTSPVSGKNSSVLPRAAAGRPSSRTWSASPSMRDAARRLRQRGRAARRSAASKAALCSAVEPCTGSLQRELAFFGNAFLAAHQPGGLEPDVERRGAGQRAAA